MVTQLCFIRLYSRYLHNNVIMRLMKTQFEENPLTGRLLFSSNNIGYIEPGTFDHIASNSYL